MFFLFHFRKCVTRYMTISRMDTHSVVSLSSTTRYLLHAIQSGTGFEPIDLLLVHRVIQTDIVHLAILVLDLRFDRLKESHQTKEKINRTFENFIRRILKARRAIHSILLSFQTPLFNFNIFSFCKQSIYTLQTLPGAKSFNPRRLILSLG